MVDFFCNSKIFPSVTDPLSFDKEEGIKKEKHVEMENCGKLQVGYRIREGASTDISWARQEKK